MKRISIRWAVITPFLVIIAVMITLLVFMLNESYEQLSKDQADRVIDLMDARANNEVFAVLESPKSIGQIYSTLLSKDEFYTYTSFESVEVVLLELIKEIHTHIPQVTTLGFGDERGNFVGVRSNLDGTFTMMLKDETTGNFLNIYEGDSRYTEILASYEGYDPRGRPWYAPVKENPIVQWSEIYINMDELNDATISSLIPVFNKDDSALVGVVSVDVNLRRINEFLGSIASTSSGTIYVVDGEGQLISHSTDQPIYNLEEEEVHLTKAVESENILIATSAEYLSSLEVGQLKSFQLEGKRYYMKTSDLNQQGIDWHLAVVVPEESLVGDMRNQFNALSIGFIVMAVIGLFIGTLLLSLFITAITKISNDLYSADPDHQDAFMLEAGQIRFRETEQLIEGFNSLLVRLRNSMDELLSAQAAIKEMTEEENSRLEQLVKEKTSALEDAMEELYKKEKMASLGGLVSGISHEINTPLGVAVSAMSHLETSLGKKVDQIRQGKVSLQAFNDFIDVIEESVAISLRNLSRAKELINSFKKISVDQSSENFEPFMVKAYIRMTLTSLAHELKINKIEVSVTGEEVELFGNPGSFSQLLTNLIMNSITHGFKDRSGGQIMMDVKVEGDQLIIDYRDDGVGIDPEILHQVFDPFFTTNRAQGGSGLGLSIVQNIIYAQYDGSVSVANLPEGGLQYLMRIPMNKRKERISE